MALGFFAPFPAAQEQPATEQREHRSHTAHAESSQGLLALLGEIEAQIRGRNDDFHSYAAGRLAPLFLRFDAGHAEALWRDAFYGSLSLQRKSLHLSVEEVKEDPRTVAYRRGSEQTPARIQASVFRDVVLSGRLALAEEFLLHLPEYGRQELRGAEVLPLTLRGEEELARALCMLPAKKLGKSPEEAVQQFGLILSRFPNFSYPAARSFLDMLKERDPLLHQASAFLMNHFQERRLDAEDLPVSLGALRDFSDALPSFGKDDSRAGASLVMSRWRALLSKSNAWDSVCEFLWTRVSAFLPSDQRVPCKENAGSSSRGGALRTDNELQKIKDQDTEKQQILVLAQSDTEKAIQKAEDLPRSDLTRAETLTDLARSLRETDSDRAASLLRRSLDSLEGVKEVPEWRLLLEVTRIAEIALPFDRAVLRSAASKGKDLLSDRNIENPKDFDQLALTDAAIRFFGVWSIADRAAAVTAAKSLSDDKIRVRVLIEIARYWDKELSLASSDQAELRPKDHKRERR